MHATCHGRHRGLSCSAGEAALLPSACRVRGSSRRFSPRPLWFRPKAEESNQKSGRCRFFGLSRLRSLRRASAEANFPAMGLHVRDVLLPFADEEPEKSLEEKFSDFTTVLPWLSAEIDACGCTLHVDAETPPSHASLKQVRFCSRHPASPFEKARTSSRGTHSKATAGRSSS